jgi:hypothetical protein
MFRAAPQYCACHEQCFYLTRLSTSEAARGFWALCHVSHGVSPRGLSIRNEIGAALSSLKAIMGICGTVITCHLVIDEPWALAYPILQRQSIGA